MLALCSLQLIILEKYLPHISHLNGFFPSCTDTECILKLPFVVKSELQISQLNDFLIDFSILVNNSLSLWADDYWLSRQENYRKQETEQACYCYENFQQINHATCHLWYQTIILGIYKFFGFLPPKFKFWLELLGINKILYINNKYKLSWLFRKKNGVVEN